MKNNRITQLIYTKLNNLSIRSKLVLVYVTCMFFPLILTDGIIFSMLRNSELRDERLRMENTANSVKYLINSAFDEAVSVINKIYLDEEVYKFLDDKYESNYDFYVKSYEFRNKILLPLEGGTESSFNNVILCSDNEGLVNGGNIYNLSAINWVGWQDLLTAKNKVVVSFIYLDENNTHEMRKKSVSVIRALDHYKWYERNMLVYVELDYGALQRKLKGMAFDNPIYLCEGDRILLTNIVQKSSKMDYDLITDEVSIDYEVPWNVYGRNFRIIISRKENMFFKVVRENIWIILLLITFNLLAPILIIRLINRSFSDRLYRLSSAFERTEVDNLEEIDTSMAGEDEIGLLMNGYNAMADRLNSLIKTNYTNKLERQEIELARQNAELSALHSQIDPHFLFNILETVRMRSVLKNEGETAGMIEKMANLVRQNISWSTDYSTIEEELEFIRAYLELQQYRFGDRLKFGIETDRDYSEYRIPRLTLTTFVENACVHGMEGKTNGCRVYVRIFDRKEEHGEGEDRSSLDSIVMEIEDTGQGMADEEVAFLNDRMNNCTIEDIKGGSHVGMLNACLRLRMYTDGDAHFEIESEKEVGTYITISVPLWRLTKHD